MAPGPPRAITLYCGRPRSRLPRNFHDNTTSLSPKHHAFQTVAAYISSIVSSRAEEGGMESATTWAVPMMTQWRTLPLERKLHWLLRLGVVGCFLGHGAYGVLTKEAWVPYFGVVGIDRAWAYRLMPWIGIMDIGLGLTMAIVPLRIVLLHLTVWGLWTAALRPLSGEVVWECVERAGNYGVPLAFLALTGVPQSWRGWLTPVWPSATWPLTTDGARALHGILRVTTCLLLLGHGALGAFHSTPVLTAHYASIGLTNVMVGGLTLTQR